jgi:exonuclease SbcC
VRPLKLEIRGLRSYVDARVIEFDGVDLAAIIGDTGAGKSSILEAICFALYGKPSWSGSEAKSLISHGVDTMEVRFAFAAGGQTWEVYRSTSKGSYPAPRHSLACAALGTKLDGKKDVDEKVQALVGLDHKTFLHCVILPQGRFQELLRAKPAVRTSLLKGVFQLDALDRLRDWAADTLRERQPQFASLCEERARLRQDPEAEAEAARAALEDAQAQAQALRAAQERHRAHAQAAAEADKRASGIDGLVSRLDAAAVAGTRVHIDEVRAAASRIAADQAALAARRSAHETERARVAEALAAHAREHTDGAGLLRAGKALDRVTALVESMGSDHESVAGCQTEAKAARKARDGARTKHQNAVDKREQAQLADTAAHLAATLVPGEACPVCAHPVQSGFHAPAPPDLAKADKAVTTARAALDKAERALDKAERALAEAVRQSEDHARKLRETLDDLPAALRPAIDAGQAPGPGAVDAIAAARARLQALRDQTAALEQRRDALARDLADIDKQAKALDGQHTREVLLRGRDLHAEVAGYVRAQAALAALLGRAPLQPPPKDADIEALGAVAGALAAEAAAILADAASRAAEARQTRGDAEAQAREILAALGCATPDDLTQRMGRLDFEIEHNQKRHQDALSEVEPARALDQRIATAGAYLDVLDEIRAHMADGKFLGYAVARKQEALLTVASRLLGDMTSGRFGFGEDFTLVDRRAGEARDAETLSGGETFLASLALALALVELAGRAGGRLEALFLDEGFGSLDADALDLAIEALVGQARQGRLVAVISHIRAVAESIDDVLYVRTTPTGSDARWLDASERSALALDDAGLLG